MKQKMKRTVIFAALTAALLTTACSHPKDSSSANEGNAIEFRAVIDKTRASLVTATQNLTSFFVQAGMTGDSNLDFMSVPVWTADQGATWNYAPVKYYPATGTVDFYAYAPIQDVNMTSPLDNSAADCTFDYTVPNDQSVINTSCDLLVASVLGNSASPVALEFNHALSAVTFTASNQNAASTNLIYRIDSIKITELDNEGTFSYATATWSNNSNADVTYVAGIPETGACLRPTGSADYFNLLSANDVMMVLPQEPVALGTIGAITAGVPDDNGTYVEVTYTLTDATGMPVSGNASDTRKLALPTGFTFDPGILYNFQFDFGAPGSSSVNPISFSVTVNDWTAPTTDPTPLD